MSTSFLIIGMTFMMWQTVAFILGICYSFLGYRVRLPLLPGYIGAFFFILSFITA